MLQTVVNTNTTIEYSDEIKAHVFNYVLQLADTSLILAHKLSEWCGHGPILEQDMAMTNIALDLIGETRSLYQYATELEGKGRSEDDLAFLRAAVEYKNPLLVEMTNGNFGDTVMRQFLFDTFHYYLLQQLKTSCDTRLSSIAEKSFKEASYHLKWSSEWVIRLGDGTDESKQKIEMAVDQLFPYTGELFHLSLAEKVLIENGIIPEFNMIEMQWKAHISKVFEAATLQMPLKVFMQKGGKEGKHSEGFGFILSELQYMQRAYPGMEW